MSEDKKPKVGRHAAAKQNPNTADDTEKVGRHAAAAEKTDDMTETVDDQKGEEATQQTPDTADDRENAPRSIKPEPEIRHAKRRGLPIICAALVLALAVGGYLIARNKSADRQEAALNEEEEIPVVTAAATAQPEEDMSDENRAAMAALAGEDTAVEADMSYLVGGDELTGENVDTQSDDDVVVAEYDGGSVLSSEAAEAYSAKISSLIFDGFDEEEVGSSVLTGVLEDLVSERILKMHAQELGLCELTDEDETQIEAQAEQSYSEQMDLCRQSSDTQNMSDEEVEKYLRDYEGVTLDSVKSEIEDGWWKQKIYDAITQDVTVDDAQVRTSYDTLLEEQQERFGEYPDDYESEQMSGGTIVYNLPGYRAVRLLLIGFDDGDTAAEVAELSGEDADEDAQTRLDELYAQTEEKAQEVLAQLNAGADFEEMIVQYGSDEGMKDEMLRGTGYYVSEDSLLWSSEMIEAAMALENVGDISGMIRLDGGVGLLQYVGEVPEGAVAYEDVKEALTQETLANMKQETYDAQLATWIESANVKYYPERMQ